MNTRLENKAAIVTGAATGIAEAIALALASTGARVVVNHLNTENGLGRPEETAAVVALSPPTRPGRAPRRTSWSMEARYEPTLAVESPRHFKVSVRGARRQGNYVSTGVYPADFFEEEPVGVAR